MSISRMEPPLEALAATWTSRNPVLRQGQLAYESNTGKAKLGDGTTAWADLPYLTGSSNEILDQTAVLQDHFNHAYFKAESFTVGAPNTTADSWYGEGTYVYTFSYIPDWTGSYLVTMPFVHPDMWQFEVMPWAAEAPPVNAPPPGGEARHSGSFTVGQLVWCSFITWEAEQFVGRKILWPGFERLPDVLTAWSTLGGVSNWGTIVTGRPLQLRYEGSGTVRRFRGRVTVGAGGLAANTVISNQNPPPSGAPASGIIHSSTTGATLVNLAANGEVTVGTAQASGAVLTFDGAAFYL